jgi:phenylalanyl-tRNA synthetase beta chain
MKFTLGWLRDHLDTTASLDTLTTVLTNLGLEVEEVRNPAAALRDFIVAEIVTATQHPNADRLRVCSVNTGSGEPVQVVCGAPNARADLKTVFAAPGVVIPASGQALKVGDIRGVASHGMLCSAAELGLGIGMSQDSGGIIELSADAVPGSPAAVALRCDEPVIEIAVTPNRGDCLGMRGIARDLAAAGMGVFKDQVAGDEHQDALPAACVISPDAAAITPAFALQRLTGVVNGASPDWLQQRLRAVGLKPLSALVDVTTYSALDLGRPLHVFDADKIQGNVTVRLSRDGERFAALNHEVYTLPAGLLVICDDSGVISLAGVMGGASTACTSDTRNVLVESALFDAVKVAEAGRALGIHTDARARFERGTDPALVLPGLMRAVTMIQDVCGGVAEAPTLAGSIPPGRRTLPFHPDLVRTLGGVDLPGSTCFAILERLGCEQCMATSPQQVITVPSWRPDLLGAADLVEEILRIQGYDHIPATALPPVDSGRTGTVPPAVQRARAVKQALAGAGWNEAVSWSFTDPKLAEHFGGGEDALRLRNPISSELAAMRPSILPGLLLAAHDNIARSMQGEGLFEVGPVFRGLTPEQQETAAAGVRWGHTPRHWQETSRPWDVFDAKAAALLILAACGLDGTATQISRDAPGWYHPGRSLMLRLGKVVLGQAGELHPRTLHMLELPAPVVAFELFLDRIPFARVKGSARPPFHPSDFQPVTRDFAFLLDATTPADEVVRAVRSADRKIIDTISVFDSYSGKGVPAGKASLALSVRLQPQERTLTEADLAAVSQRIVAAVQAKAGGVLRG